MSIKMAVAFANIFLARRENQILKQMNRTLCTRGFFSRAEGCFSVSAMERGYPAAIVLKNLSQSEVLSPTGKQHFQQRNKSARRKLLPPLLSYNTTRVEGILKRK